jgi:hypothetical protein
MTSLAFMNCTTENCSNREKDAGLEMQLEMPLLFTALPDGTLAHRIIKYFRLRKPVKKEVEVCCL